MSHANTSRLVTRRAWLVIVLCGLAGALFHMDRQTFSVLKVTLKGEFGWTDTHYGWMVSVFMLFYTTAYLFSGRWIDRWGSRVMMPIFVVTMSLATILSGLAGNLLEMGACRALLGVAEAGVMPAVMVAVFRWFPPDRRGMANAIKEPLYVIGQVLATPLAALLTARWSWHTAFFIPGLFGTLVAVAWWYADRGEPVTSAPVAEATSRFTYGDVLKRKEIWGVILARLVSDPLWFFFIYWEPGFLQERLGMSLTDLAKVGWIPTTVGVTALVVLGYVSDRLIVRFGWSPPRSRRVILQWAAAIAPLVVLLQFSENRVIVISLLCVVRVMMVVWLTFSNLLLADLVPQKMIGTSIALISAFGAGTGLICNTFVGPVLGSMGYGIIFTLGAFLHPLAAVILWFWYGRKESLPAVPSPMGC